MFLKVYIQPGIPGMEDMPVASLGVLHEEGSEFGSVLKATKAMEAMINLKEFKGKLEITPSQTAS